MEGWIQPLLLSLPLHGVQPLHEREHRAAASSVFVVAVFEVTQREHPNRLVPTGAMLEQGDSVVLEVDWSGTLKVPVGRLPAGGTRRAVE